MNDITKAIVPIAGLATRFLPLSKGVPKELLPVGLKPMLQHGLDELKAAGVTHVIFIAGSNRKQVEDYLKRSPQLEKLLQERGQTALLEELQGLQKSLEGMSFTFVSVAKPQGDGHAVLQARKFIGDEPCFVLYPDDLLEASVPACVQLAQVFKTSLKPVTALARLQKEHLSSYGVVGTEKIASRLHKIKKIVEKPQGEAPSDLAVVGRRIITPEVFEYLKATKPNKKGEVVLTEALGDMVKDGKIVYGYEVEGRWWEAGTKEEWLKTHLHYALSHPRAGKELREFVKEEIRA
ncbi:MAG: UTP--glucose-1-phosphate uridylyltransferase [bacterium]|nr:UTP--glucose-1-phosphate uridylyltransferase [bacterium]